MKKILLLSIVLMSVGVILFAQEQDPGFSNTTGLSFGQSHLKKDANLKFNGIFNYFSGNIQIEKLTFSGDIAFVIFEDGTNFNILENYDANLNVIINPLWGLDLAVGTNLDWTVGPGPSYGPDFSTHDIPYFGGLGAQRGEATTKDMEKSGALYPVGAPRVVNYYADRALAARYRLEDFLEVGFAFSDFENGNSFRAGLGMKANILDIVTVGVAYEGPFDEGDNYFYVGATIHAVKGFEIGAYWNMLTDSSSTADNGAYTVGANIDFSAGRFRLKPEFGITIWNNNNYENSFYAGIDTYINFTDAILFGLNASFAIGSKDDTAGSNKAGNRLDIIPYMIWNVNEKNSISAGIHLIPVWWQDSGNTFGWEIPIAWKVAF